MAGAAKRILYNVGWKKVDWLWAAIIHAGLLPFVRPIFENVLARHTRPRLRRCRGGVGEEASALEQALEGNSFLPNPRPKAEC
jgi:hypothetical protein